MPRYRKTWATVQQAFDYVADQLGSPPIPWRMCWRSDQENGESSRQYMHTWCGRFDGVCVAKATRRLPLENLIALIAHEVSHLINGYGPGDEREEHEADEVGGEILGEEIVYDRRAVQTVGQGVTRQTALKRYRCGQG